MLNLVNELFALIRGKLIVSKDNWTKTPAGDRAIVGTVSQDLCFQGLFFRLFYDRQVCASALGIKYPALLVCRYVSLTH